MQTGIAGLNWSANYGDEIDLSPAEAKALINAGHAVKVAVSGATENAAKQTRPPKGRRKEKRDGQLNH